jgi:hypothetical protein
MATYKELQKYVKEKYNCIIETCWIAHMKELQGLNPKIAPNRKSKNYRVNPCPEHIKPLIINAFKYYKMI